MAERSTNRELVGWPRRSTNRELVRMAERCTHKELVRMTRRCTHKNLSGWPGESSQALVKMAERSTHKALVRMAERSTHKEHNRMAERSKVCGVSVVMVKWRPGRSLSQGIKKLDSNRMAERSKAPDSKNFLLLSQGDESSGPRMWARVRIPHLTMGSILVPPVGLGSAR
ncbi:hypothetical protein AVEN_29597-1 [Araneus ventricosus]|uniref:Uncharacterized protein n=1 Tax=Araneus ventricosus TaxID=182803 RepID=A0A4Y2VNH2_ARAVE|nr:hypothetical protein AVEN_29597-1 [Araneus ventricosus]